MRTVLTIVGLAIAAFASGFAWNYYREADRAKAEARSAAARRTTLETTTSNVEGRLRAITAALAKLNQKPGKESVAGGSESSAASAEASSTKPSVPAGRATAETVIANDPQRMAAYLQNYRASLDLTDSRIFKTLKFSTEQMEKWKDLQVWLRQLELDYSVAAQAKGVEPNSAASKRLQMELVKTRQDKEAEVLGNLLPAYRDFQRTLPARYVAEELVWTGRVTGENPTSDQLERTTQILAANCQRTQTGFVKADTLDWETARRELQQVLSPAQIGALSNLLKEQTAKTKFEAEKKRLTAEFTAKMKGL